MRIPKTFTTFVGAVLIAASFLVAPVAASVVDKPAVEQVEVTGSQGAACPEDPERVRFYENVIGDTTDGNDSILFCGAGVPDLDAFEHTLSGGCKAKIAIDDDWDDCISSGYAIIPAGRRLCVYSERNYQGPFINCYNNGGTMDGQRVNIQLNGEFDGMSSWRFLNNCPPTCS